MNKQTVNLDALLSYSPLQHKGNIPLGTLGLERAIPELTAAEGVRV